MIHRKKGRKLKRTASHRKALLSNLSASLIKNEKIKTTLAKAKELRTYIEPLITKAKKAYLNKDSKNAIHLRRLVRKLIHDKEALIKLFDEVAPKVTERNGGYTRVMKTGTRSGDGAQTAVIELVDFNIKETKDVKKASESEKSKEEETRDVETSEKKEKSQTKQSSGKKTIKKSKTGVKKDTKKQKNTDSGKKTTDNKSKKSSSQKDKKKKSK